MLSREVAQKVLGRCLITGGDFAEIFEEDSLKIQKQTLNNQLNMFKAENFEKITKFQNDYLQKLEQISKRGIMPKTELDNFEVLVKSLNEFSNKTDFSNVKNEYNKIINKEKELKINIKERISIEKKQSETLWGNTVQRKTTKLQRKHRHRRRRKFFLV